MKIVVCKECEEEKQHYARGVCRQCYKHLPDQLEKAKTFSDKYRKEHREELRLKEIKRRTENPEVVKQTMKIYYEKNKESLKEKRLKYYRKLHPKVYFVKGVRKIKSVKIKGPKEKKTVDITEKVIKQKKQISNISNEIKQLKMNDEISIFLKQIMKIITIQKDQDYVIDLIGADIKTVKHYIEGQFEFGMSWDNTEMWTLDVAKLFENLDLSNGFDQKKQFHYSNLKPKPCN